MKPKIIYYFLNYLIAAVWLINGLYCKVLNQVPRHAEIVNKILGSEHALLFTKLIGVSEILMAVWIITRIKPKMNVVFQIAIIMTMNTIEFFFAKDLLMWGKLNILFALLFCSLIYVKEFVLNHDIKYSF